MRLVVNKGEKITNPRPGMRPIAYKPVGNITRPDPRLMSGEEIKSKIICSIYSNFKNGYYIVHDPHDKMRVIYKGYINKDKVRKALSVLNIGRGYTRGRVIYRVQNPHNIFENS